MAMSVGLAGAIEAATVVAIALALISASFVGTYLDGYMYCGSGKRNHRLTGTRDS